MNLPTQEDIKLIGSDLANTLGGGVHLTASDLTFSVDSAFPGMTESEFSATHVLCAEVAGQIRGDALHKLWC
jgi:hypothetical protein